jgi:hypothetical protein
MDMNDKFLKVRFASVTPQMPKECHPQSKGRNGLIKTTGVQIYTNEHDNLVQLSPITTKGQPSDNCYVEVPFEKKALLELADKLQFLASHAPEAPQT